MIELSLIQDGIGVLVEEGISVFVVDSQKYGISRVEKKFLFTHLEDVASFLRNGYDLKPLIDAGFLKKLTHDAKCIENNLWEIRDPGRGGRLIFVLDDPESIIISAVSKRVGSQNQAIKRGMKRWGNFLKKQKKQ